MKTRRTLFFSALLFLAMTCVVAFARVGVAADQADATQMLAQARTLLENAVRELDNNADAIQSATGLARILHERLMAHTALVAAGADPQSLLLLAQLDSGLIDQLANRTFVPLSNIRGASAAVLPAIGAHKLAYPVAIFVPLSYAPDKSSPLIVYLHGKDESEADAVASPLIRTLATETGAIVVAPSTHGNDMLSDDSISEVYQVADELESAFHVDRSRIYLAGNSLGGFAAFKALAHESARWAGLLVIEGAVAESDSVSVATHVRGKSVFLVAGSDDQNVAASYERGLVSWLRNNGALVTYYEQPNGTHSLSSVAPKVAQAWHDMLGGPRVAQPQGNGMPATAVPPSTAPTMRP